MPKNFYITMIALGSVLGVILIVENIIGASGIVYTLVWQSSAGLLITFSLVCGFLIGYGLKGFLSSDKEKNDIETF